MIDGANENDNENENYNENDNENENGLRRTQRDTEGCPQADFVGEQQLSAIRQQLKEVFIKLKQVTRISRELKEMGPQADFVGEQQLSALASA